MQPERFGRNEAVLEGIRRWRSEPAQRDGVKVRVRWPVRQTCRLDR